jgi:hypothetical protein
MKNLTKTIEHGYPATIRCINKETLDYVEIGLPMGTCTDIRLCLLKHAHEYCTNKKVFGESEEDPKFDYYVILSRGEIGHEGYGAVRAPSTFFSFNIDITTNKLTDKSIQSIKEKLGINEEVFMSYLIPGNLL